jgi:glycosyltransferase involved in cell wall biosynthesis
VSQDPLEKPAAAPVDKRERARRIAYWCEEVAPLVDGEWVRWIGSVDGLRRRDLLAQARALVAPVLWDEPGATAALEALASGTPVVALRRGALAAIVQDGATGFLAEDETGLIAALRRLDELDPAACRRHAEERFSAARMADGYLSAYERILAPG